MLESDGASRAPDVAECESSIRAAIARNDVDVRVLNVSPWVMTCQIAERYREGRIFLVGDAAGVCKVNDLYGVEWAYIPHFYYDFYVYQYATSITASAQIAANIRAQAAAGKPSTQSRDAYLKMLSSGSSKYPIDLLKDAGVDMTAAGPFNAAIQEMNGIMDEMEKLLGGDK